MERNNLILSKCVFCPCCNELIEISYEEIINGAEAVCPECGLKISVTKGASDKAIEILKKLKNT